MRALVSGILVCAAVVLAALALPAAWADRNLRSADGFARLAAPLGSDPVFQDALARALASEAAASAPLPDAVKELARPLLEEAADELKDQPGYGEAYTDTLRRSHKLTLEAAATSSDGAIRLDVAPLAELLADAVSERLGVQVPAPQKTELTLPESGLLPPGLQQQLLSLIPVSAGWPWLAAGAVLAALLALAAARGKGNALLGLGIGVVLMAAAQWLILEGAMGWVAGVDNTDVAGLFTKAFAAAAAEGYRPWILMAAGSGVILAAAGAAVRALRAGRSAESAAQR